MKSCMVLALAITATLANADVSYKCAETSALALEQGRSQYSVFITQLEKITNPKVVGEYDAAYRVRVSILARNPKVRGSKFTLDRPSFEAVAKTQDVVYSLKKGGFSVNFYMDENEPASVRIPGVSEKLGMNCRYFPEQE